MFWSKKLTLINRDIEHNIERYWTLPHNPNEFLQYIDCSVNFFQQKLNRDLDIYETPSFNDIINNEYGISDIEPHFRYLDKSAFFFFFKNQGLDIPQCFAQSKSLMSKQNGLPLLKLINFFMRHGQKLQMTASILTCLSKFNRTYGSLHRDLNTKNWRSLFMSFTFIFKPGTYKKISPVQNELMNFTNRATQDVKHITINFNTYSIIFQNLVRFEPMFSFYIYKVDKKIFKNTRGKSGKYTFLWKFIPPYKRQFFVFTWLARELRLKPGRSIKLRLSDLINNLITQPNKMWISRVKKFSYNYVYRNCRHTLSETYRTVTK